MEKTVKMLFNKNYEYEGNFYSEGKIYDIPAEKVERWLKRGAVIASEITETPKAVEAHKEVVDAPTKQGQTKSGSGKSGNGNKSHFKKASSSDEDGL